jgi:hypothetical protein
MNKSELFDLEEVIDRLNEELVVDEEEVKPNVLKRKVWVATWGIPGCLPESRSICRTKESAIESALWFAESEEGDHPKGMLTALRKDGFFYCDSSIFGRVINKVYQMPLKDLI